jgi:hypothetical protein
VMFQRSTGSCRHFLRLWGLDTMHIFFLINPTICFLRDLFHFNAFHVLYSYVLPTNDPFLRKRREKWWINKYQSVEYVSGADSM